METSPRQSQSSGCQDFAQITQVLSCKWTSLLDLSVGLPYRFRRSKDVRNMQLYIASRDTRCAGLCLQTARSAGWTVELVATGQNLLTLVRDASCAPLCLVDVSLPDIDAFTLAEALADLRRPIRLRFLSDVANSDVIAARMKAAALDLPVGMSLLKPVDQARFRRMLAEEARFFA